MDKQLIGVGILVLDKTGKKVLLGKRINSYKSGWYGMPGGRLDLKEPIEMCGKRELTEETGLEAVSFKYLGSIRDFQITYNFIHFGYACKDYKGEPQVTEPDKCEAWEWFDFDKIPENTLPGHKAIIDLYFNPQLNNVRDLLPDNF